VTKISPQKQVETQSRDMVLIFRTTPVVVRCMSAAPFVATALYFIQSKPCSWMNWFNLAKMAWAVEQTPTFRRNNSTMVLVSKWFCTLETDFFHWQCLSGDASKNVFDLFWWVEFGDLVRFWDVLEPNYFYQICLYKIGNALKDTGSAFLLLYDKTHTRCRHRTSICAS